MRSLAKPRKIKIAGSNGLDYSFLGKPKDDLRKDARLMDFNSIINKLLKANSDSRRRQLRAYILSVSLPPSKLIIRNVWRRYPNVRCRHAERGMWLHPVGATYGAHPAGSLEVV